VIPRESLATKKEVWLLKRKKTHFTSITLRNDYLQVFTHVGSSEHTQNGVKPILTFDGSF